jgi:hypothetical protein
MLVAAMLDVEDAPLPHCLPAARAAPMANRLHIVIRGQSDTDAQE